MAAITGFFCLPRVLGPVGAGSFRLLVVVAAAVATADGLGCRRVCSGFPVFPVGNETTTRDGVTQVKADE
jgi:hypothetical protein